MRSQANIRVSWSVAWLSSTRLGIGTALVAHVLATGAELNLKAACSAVVVTALNPNAYSWWQRFRFAFDAGDHTNFDLYLLTKDITATL